MYGGYLGITNIAGGDGMDTYWDAFIKKYNDRLADVFLRDILQAFYYFSNNTKEGKVLAEEIMRSPEDEIKEP